MTEPIKQQTPLDAQGPKVPQLGQIMAGKVATNIQAPRDIPKGPATSPARPTTSLAAKVNAEQGRTLAIPASVGPAMTTEALTSKFFHGILYAETDALKTCTALDFGGPQFTRIILTRGEEQLIPVEGEGFQFRKITDSVGLEFAMMYPERLWPDWAAMDDPDGRRTIVIDDVTCGIDMVLGGQETNHGLKKYGQTKDDFVAWTNSLRSKPYNLILIALAKPRENDITNVETIGPDIPPALLRDRAAEFEYVFFLNKQKKMILTQEDSFAVTDTDQNGKQRTYTRIIFAKSKFPRRLIGPNCPVKKEEKRDLWDIWQRIKNARTGGK